MPKVSVIIPTYNAANWLKQSIDSVLRQIFTDYELIIIDDGSTDDTSSIVKSFDDKRIRYFHKANGGVASARNMGLDKATGEYIAFLDSDDLWPESYLEVIVLALEKASDYGLAYTAMTVSYPDGTITKHFRASDCVSGWTTCNLFNKEFIWAQASVFRKSLLDRFRWDELLKTGSDYDAFLRLSLKTPFLFVPDIEIVRRVRKDSVGMHSFSSTVNCNKLRVQERFYYRLDGKDCIPNKDAMRRIARTYMHTATCYYSQQARKASVYLFGKAFLYNPFDLRIITGLLKALMLKRKSDTVPDWQIPIPLGEPMANDYSNTKATDV
jgi:glycosyltransferase involved in cell wall biosynthesis